MATTRIAPPTGLPGVTDTARRDRVDPYKLLALIERVKTAAGETDRSAPAPQPYQPSAKAG